MSRWLNTLILAIPLVLVAVAGIEPASAVPVTFQVETLGCAGGAPMAGCAVSVRRVTAGGPVLYGSTGSNGLCPITIVNPVDEELLEFKITNPVNPLPIVTFLCRIDGVGPGMDDYVLLYPPAGGNPQPPPPGTCDIKAGGRTVTVKLINYQNGE